jgi:serine/threonine protein phosphatase PrpC
MMIAYACYSNPGNRPINEDAIGVHIKDNDACFVVCDGLGGHGKGDEASCFVKDFFLSAFSQADKADCKFIERCFIDAQASLSEIQKEKKQQDKMKTTCVCLTLQGKKAHIGYIGDSRLYGFGDKAVKHQTQDHSVPYMLYLSKQIRYEDIRNHTDRNLLLRVMGTTWDEPKYQLYRAMPLRKFRAFLLCTDGFWELITEEKMCQFLMSATTVEEWLNAMVQEVQQNGANKDMDNYSAIAIFCK